MKKRAGILIGLLGIGLGFAVTGAGEHRATAAENAVYTGKLAIKYPPEIIMKLLFPNAANKTGPKDKLTVKEWKYVPRSLVVLYSPEVQEKDASDIF